MSSWYQEALDILDKQHYEGIVYISLARNGETSKDISEHLRWEQTAMNRSDVILLWVPSKPDQFLMYSTYVEFERCLKGRNIIWGYPQNTFKIQSIDKLAREYAVPVVHSLSEAVDNVLGYLGSGAERKGGETHVPLYLWNLPHFKSWLLSQKKVGNRLEEVYSIDLRFVVGQEQRTFLLFWGMHVNLFVAVEQRYKKNEIVISRPDIQYLVAFHWPEGKSLGEVEVVLIREFRSTATTHDGFIHEVPGGSSYKSEKPETVAVKEFQEETGTGIVIDPNRLKFLNCRQLAGTTSAHKAHVFAVHLTESEIARIKQQQGQPCGNKEETELTYPEVFTVQELLKNAYTDWSNLGMIFTALYNE